LVADHTARDWGRRVFALPPGIEPGTCGL